MSSPEIATAYVSVIPSLRNFPGMLQAQMVGPITTAGNQAGSAAGQAVGSRIGPAMKAGVVAAAAVAGALLVRGITEAIDRGRIQNRLQAQLGATTKDAERYGDVAGRLYAKGISENFQAGADAVRQVISGGLAPPDATLGQLETIAARMTDVSTTFGYDMEWMGKSVNAMLRNDMAPSAEAALDIITTGLQRLGPNAEDLLETFQEYPVQLKQLGIDAHESLGLFSQGLQAGARDTDIIADALKEFGIRAVDMSDASREAYEILGLSAEEMEAQIMKGGQGAQDGLQLVLDKLREMGPTTEREAAAVGLFGTQAEELNDALFALDPSSAMAAMEDVGGAAERLGETLHTGPGHEIEVFKRRMETALVDFAGNQVIPALTSVATYVRDDLAPAFQSAAGFVADGAGGVWDWLTDIPAVSGLQSDVADTVASLDDLGPALASAGDAARDRFFPAVRAAGGYITDKFRPVIETVAEFARETMAPAFRLTGERISEFGQKLWPISRAIMIFQGAVAAAVLWLVSKLVPVLGDIAGPIMGAFYDAMTFALIPVGYLLDGLVWLGGALADLGRWFVDMWGVVQPVLSTLWEVAKTVFTAIIVTLLIPILVPIAAVGAAFWAIWEFGIKPMLTASRDALKAFWTNVVQPVFNWIGDKAGWLNDKAIKPAFRGIKASIDFVRDGLVWFKDKVVNPVFNWIGDKAGWLWREAIKPPFDKIKEGAGAVGDAFESAKDFIGEQWDALKDLVRDPVQFIIDVVYNNGIRKLWNTVAGVVGAGTLPSVQLGYATGGILPGYTPGRDVHVAALSGGEAVMRPEFTRGAGASWVHSMNAIARTQGVSGVRAAMEGQGGNLPGYFLGGIVGQVGNWVSQGVNWARETGAGWIGDKLRALVDAVASQIPGANTDYGQMIAKIPGAFVGKMTDLIAGREADAGGTWGKPVGSPIGTRYGVSGPMWSSGSHTGTDFPAPTGTPIRAVADGIVSGVANGGPYGRNMRLSHPGGYQSFYAHLSSFIKGVGDQVSRGDHIGRVGSSGNSSGPHLHLEAYKSGARINPETLFDRGGWLMPGAQMTRNNTGSPEPVLTSQQWQGISTLAAQGAGGLRPGDRLILSLDGRREFEAYVDGRAESAAERTITSTLVRPAGIGRQYA